MINESIRSKIRKIQIHSKRLMQSSFVGDYTSAFKGSGLEFEQIREYQLGDDVRRIDWNSSAKNNKMMVKQFIEERERTIILAIDVSASSIYSSQQELRQDLIAQLSGTLALVAAHNKDKVGALFFSDRVERWIAPSRGPTHIGNILEAIFTTNPTGKETNIEQALKFLIKLKKRNAVIFMLSDWIDTPERYENILKVARCTYDFVGIRILDTCERALPDVGLLDIQDPETGILYTLDTAKHKKILLHLQTRLLEQKRMFEKYKIDLLDITIGHSFVNQLVMFLHQRIRRQI